MFNCKLKILCLFITYKVLYIRDEIIVYEILAMMEIFRVLNFKWVLNSLCLYMRVDVKNDSKTN